MGQPLDTSGGPARGWRRAAAWWAPNLPVLLLALSGATGEVILLARARDNVYAARDSLSLLTPLAVLWFWLTLGWVGWSAARATAALTRPWRAWLRLPARAVLLGIAALAAAGYAASWCFYLRSGRFANLEAAEFAVENAKTGELWGYVFRTERWVLAGFAALVLVLFALLPLLVRRVVHASWGVPAGRGLCWRRMASWGLLTAVVGGLMVWSGSGRSDARGYAWAGAVCNRLNPALTLAASLKDHFFDPEKIEPCIDVAELVPLTRPWQAPPLGPNPPSIIYVAVESLRNDVIHLRHQGREVMPNLNALARGGLNLTRAYAQSTHSDYSDVCIVSSLYPLRTRRHHYYRRSDPWPKTRMYDLLKPLGYATAIISSQNEAWCGMDQFLESPNLDLLYDAERNASKATVNSRDSGLYGAVKSGELRAGKLDDGHTIDVSIAWVTKQVRQGKPFFLSIDFQDSHFPYDMEADAPRPFQPGTIDFDASFLDYPPDKDDVVRNAYYNALHESDRQLGRLVEALRRLGKLDDTILVVYGENGEAFHENGSVTHAREPVEPAVRVACVVHSPRFLKPGVEGYPFELIDISPTVLGLLKWPAHPNFQGTDVLSPDRVPAAERLLFLHTENVLSRTDAVLLGGRWKLHHDRNTGREMLYDVATDPGESPEHDLIAAKPELAERLRAALGEWRKRQLAYYHYSRYYTKYYPPRPPRWTEVGGKP